MYGNREGNKSNVKRVFIMRIETRFDIGDEVWFMYQNKCVRSKIISIKIDLSPDIYIQYIFQLDGDVIFQSNEDIWLSEKFVFATKTELKDSL